MRFFILMVLFTTISCAMNPPSRYQNELVSMQTRILQLEEEVKAQPATMSQKNLARLQATVNRLERQLRLVNGQVDSVKSGYNGEATVPAVDNATINDLSGRVAELENQQKELIMELEKVRSTPTAKNAKAAAPTKAMASDLGELRELFNRKSYKEVLASADAVKGTLASAQKMEFDYILAETHFELGDMKNAALKFNEYLDRKPKGQAFAHAKLRMGDCFRQLGDLDTAKIYYNEVIQYDSKMAEAATAKKRLQQM